jgi:spore germination protein
MKLTVSLIIVVVVLFGCASKKNVTVDVPQKSPYTTDNTVVEQEVAPVDTVVVPEIKIHVVKKGESLWVIARKYGVTVQDLVKANNIENKNIIKINQELIIPEKRKK